MIDLLNILCIFATISIINNSMKQKQIKTNRTDTKCSISLSCSLWICFLCSFSQYKDLSSLVLPKTEMVTYYPTNNKGFSLQELLFNLTNSLSDIDDFIKRLKKLEEMRDKLAKSKGFCVLREKQPLSMQESENYITFAAFFCENHAQARKKEYMS